MLSNTIGKLPTGGVKRFSQMAAFSTVCVPQPMLFSYEPSSIENVIGATGLVAPIVPPPPLTLLTPPPRAEAALLAGCLPCTSLTGGMLPGPTVMKPGTHVVG